MNDEIKEILDFFQKDVDKYEESKRYLMKKYGYDEETIDNISQHERHINIKKLLDYITNLQQDLEKANDIIAKDRQFYKNRMDEYVELKKENERLKEANVYCNRTDCSGRLKDSRKYDSVYQEKEDYKSRIEKAVEYFKYQLENLDFYEDTKARMLCAMGITLLQNGSDNNGQW